MKRIITFLILLSVFLSLASLAGCGEKGEVLYGYVVATEPGEFIIASMKLPGETKSSTVRINTTDTKTYHTFTTIRVVANPDNIIATEGQTTDDDGHTTTYDYYILSYSSLRLSDPEKGEPLYG